MRYFFLSLFFYPFYAHSQETGIRFEKDLSWQKVKAKATEEGKSIFLECYATWCGPCKEMERTVFSNNALGREVAAHFIAVRVQIDSTGHDDEAVRGWYETAHQIGKTYGITELPSFLFFSPEGDILDKRIGFKDSADFSAMIRDVQNPDKQYYTLKERFLHGQLEPAKLSYLASTGKGLHDQPFADSVARECFTSYFPTLSEKKLLTYDNLYFLSWFINRVQSADSMFRFLRNHENAVDRVMSENGFTQNLIDVVISTEDIYPIVYNHNRPVAAEPRWSAIQSSIAGKYGPNIASHVVLDNQIEWYYRKKDWPRVVEYFIDKNNRYGLDTLGQAKYFLNNQIFTIIFLHSTSKRQLMKGIQWMKIIVDADPHDGVDMDTYANLLYKIGNTREAIGWEEKASLLAPGESEIQTNLSKMKKGLPTWSD